MTLAGRGPVKTDKELDEEYEGLFISSFNNPTPTLIMPYFKRQSLGEIRLLQRSAPYGW